MHPAQIAQRLGAMKNRGDPAISYAADIRPLFRPFDITSMKRDAGFDLSNYDDVKREAEIIYQRLSDKSMPCDRPWSEDKIALFGRWIDDGLQP
jgi:hypothetical protein